MSEQLIMFLAGAILMSWVLASAWAVSFCVGYGLTLGIGRAKRKLEKEVSSD